MMDVELLSCDWCGQGWSCWTAEPLKQHLPDSPGVVRISDGREILSITDLDSLAKGMGYILRKLGREGLLISHLATDLPRNDRKGLRDFLRWQHRLSTGHSPTLDFGEGEGTAPLSPCGGMEDARWMSLDWSEWMPFDLPTVSRLPRGAGAYRVIDVRRRELVIVGATKDLASTLRGKGRKGWRFSNLNLAFAPLEATGAKALAEVQCDLVGGYYLAHSRSPRFQFGRWSKRGMDDLRLFIVSNHPDLL